MTARLARFTLLALFVLAACGGSSQNKPERVVTSEAKLEVLDPISFTGEAELAPSSHKVLDALASTFVGNPSLKLMEVQVHVTDGDEATRQQRADRRAQVVVDYLVGKGVEAARLRPVGYVNPSQDRSNPLTILILERR